MDFKLLGCVLLIVGTSIGAGMLALPIATAQLGFAGSLVLLVSCWFVMTVCAFLLLEVNLWLPLNSNLISMAKTTIGPIGQGIAWVTYLLLLYSLLCAYISGGSDLFQHLLQTGGMGLPVWLASILFTLFFGLVVYLGIRAVDYVNRGLMFVKLGAYLLLILLLLPFISLPHLSSGNLYHITSSTALTVTITSFGYSTIVPSLRIYFAGDVRKLKIAILIGSLIPLICYIAWDMVIMGIIPFNGPNGLAAVLQSKNSTSSLVTALSSAANSGSVTFFIKLFTSICVVTSFLGVSLCLNDFLADGLHLEKIGGQNIFIQLLCFLPPLVIVLFFPNAFIKALEYAGIYSAVLLILFPAWMAWNGRRQRELTSQFRVPGGRPLLALFIVFALVMIVRGVLG